MSLFRLIESESRPVPPIDLEQPAEVRTATFAMG